MSPSEDEFLHDPDSELSDEHGRTRAEELAEELDVPLEVAEQIAREEGDEDSADPFVDSEWLQTSD